MIGPSWLADVLAAVVLSVALFSIGRLIASRGYSRQGEVDADGVHVLMGVAMAGMFVPRLATLPTAAWAVIFAATAAWFGWRSVQVLRLGSLVATAGSAGWSGWSGSAGSAGSAGASGSAGSGACGAIERSRYLSFSGQCCEYPVPHLIDCIAMVYVFWAVRVIRSGVAPGSGGMSGMAGVAREVRLPALGLALALCICAYVVWLGDRIQLLAPEPGGSGGVAGPGRLAARVRGRALLAPRAATCCKIAMGVTMGVMLVDIL
jgi:hypothetical protein